MEQYPKQKLEKSWIQNPISNDVVNWTKSFGEHLQSRSNGTGPLTTSQIRKFFGELKRIQSEPEKFKSDIPLLKAKLAYAVGRDLKGGRPKTKIKDFHDQLIIGIDGIRDGNHDDLNRYIKIVESIVAFHKYHGGN